jgi:hypothetical protein
LTQDGHLLLFSGLDRNITLRTSGRGYVNLNSENLALLAKMVSKTPFSCVVAIFGAIYSL